MKAPRWFSEVVWSATVSVEEISLDRARLPPSAGVYVFTRYDGPLEKNTGVLYVGKAKSLNSRVKSYLADPVKLLIFAPRAKSGGISTSLRHAGKTQLLMQINQSRAYGDGSSGVWLRWTICAEPAPLEKQLIEYLQPAFNTHGKLET